jgi:hypothetical protein
MRFVRKKNPVRHFFCALCRAPRDMRYGRHLSQHHYVQIAVFTAFTTWALFPWLEWKSLGVVFIYWGALEIIRKSLYRKELKCPYCGFDATWYRRDVRVARKQVEEFVKDNPDARVFMQADDRREKNLQ